MHRRTLPVAPGDGIDAPPGLKRFSVRPIIEVMPPHPPVRRRRVCARLIGCLVAVAVTVATIGPRIALIDRAAAAEPPSGTPVMGEALITAHQLATYYYSRKGHDTAQLPTLDDDVEALARLFIEEGRRDGVRGDIAFMQSMVETGWLLFPTYGQIRPWFNNYSGMYAFDGRPKGTTCAAETSPSRCFESPRIGVRTQVHLLRSYADPSVADTPDRLAYAPRDRRGVAPVWELFGGQSGQAIWATAPDYGTFIIEQLWRPMLSRLGVVEPCVPAGANGAGAVGSGYWVFGPTGVPSAVGTATPFGSAGAAGAPSLVVDVVAHPSGAGYWQATRSGGVYAFGNATKFGTLVRANIGAPVTAMESTPSGNGYWLLTADGGVHAFGDAETFGAPATGAPRSRAIGIERTPTGAGYWVLSADGAVAAFGDAAALGSPKESGGARTPSALARTPSGGGYFVVTSRGRVLAFGDAQVAGDVHGCGFGAVADIEAAPSGNGYWITTARGAVYAFGSARYVGQPAAPFGGAVAFALAA